MKTVKFFALTVLMILLAQGRVFAEMPEISAGEMYFDMFKGCYVLKGNVHVSANNHGFKATITADEAFVSVIKQKCWADGNVKLIQEDITFSCERAYANKDCGSRRLRQLRQQKKRRDNFGHGGF